MPLTVDQRDTSSPPCRASSPPSRSRPASPSASRCFGLDFSGARWIDPENYHVTLRFIGDVDGATARDFTHALGEIDAAPFELRLNGLGSFGGRKPRAIFAEVAPSEALEALRRANERAAREAGLPPEGRNFKPHVTLARLRGARADAVAAYLERQGGVAAEPFTVSRFVLYSSRASVGGGPYVVEAAYDLAD